MRTARYGEPRSSNKGIQRQDTEVKPLIVQCRLLAMTLWLNRAAGGRSSIRGRRERPSASVRHPKGRFPFRRLSQKRDSAQSSARGSAMERRAHSGWLQHSIARVVDHRMPAGAWHSPLRPWWGSIRFMFARQQTGSCLRRRIRKMIRKPGQSRNSGTANAPLFPSLFLLCYLLLAEII